MGNSGIGSATCSRRLPGSRRGWGRAAWVGLVVLGLTFARAGWAQRSYDDLDDAVRDLTRTLVERGELVALFSAVDLAGKRVLVKSDDFFETETGFRLPLSKVLSRKCATELTRSRVPVALEGSDEDAVRVLHGRWKRLPGGRLDLTLFVAEPVQGRGEPVALVSVEGRVPVQGIKPEDIEPTLEHWGRYLVRRLDRGVRDQGRRTVRIQPLSVPDEGVARPDELGRVLEGWLAEALLESRWFEFVEPAPSGSVATVQVDGELLGSATVSGDHIKVSMRVLDNHRRRVTAASVELPKSFFDEAFIGTVTMGYGEEDDETPPPSDEVTARLAECAAHFGANRLTRPPGTNAAECYTQVLELDRGNTEALAGLARIEARYVESANGAIRQGELDEPDETDSKSPDSAEELLAALIPTNKTMISVANGAMRRLPSLVSDLVGEVEEGAIVQVMAQAKDWYQIRVGMDIAYLRRDFLRELEKLQETAIATRTAPARRSPALVMRRLPSLVSDLVGEVEEGAIVQVMAQAKDWYQIRVGMDIAYRASKVFHAEPTLLIHRKATSSAL